MDKNKGRERNEGNGRILERFEVNPKQMTSTPLDVAVMKLPSLEYSTDL